MSEHSKLTVPGTSGGDHVHLAARAAISAIPGAGGPTLEIFNALVTPPIEKRRKEWMESVGSALEELQKKDNQLIERLQKDDTFQSVLLQASWAAVRNHQAEKLTALRIAVQNSAIASDDTQLLFVRFVDELTPTHLLVLNFFVKREKEVAHLESYQQVIEAFSASCEQKLNPFLFRMVCEDLKVRGLVRISEDIHDLPGVYTEPKIVIEGSSKDPKVIVTDFGKSFVAFVLTSHLGAGA